MKDRSFNMNPRLFCISSLILFLALCFVPVFGQDNPPELVIDANAQTTTLPRIFQPALDLSGRGFHRDKSWPQTLAGKDALDTWQKDIGFSGIYRLQYNLWEISRLAADKEAKDKLLANYENVIKNISDAGGIVILDIFSTPAGTGKVLDKKSPPSDLAAYKGLVKGYMRYLSCEKKYNVWYEVWSAPDLEDFFLGKQQEYLNIYRAVAQAARELELETKIHILVGGPSSSWWFQNLSENNIFLAERSLVYQLIRFCYHNHLPLDFISWHAYSTDPKAEKETTTYNNKPTISLIRDWLSYFHFDRNTPLIIDEWNYDRPQNVLPERAENAWIAASYIPSRIKNMHQAGLDYQLYFSLEDFQDNHEGVVRNTGIFWYDSESKEYKGGSKCSYNIFRMLGSLGDKMLAVQQKWDDDFMGALVTRKDKSLAVLIYNYLDPELAKSYISRNMSILEGAEVKTIAQLLSSGEMDKLLSHQLEIKGLRASNNVKNMLYKALELSDQYKKLVNSERSLKLIIRNMEGDYLYQRYAVDASCAVNCEYSPKQEKEISFIPGQAYEEELKVPPYSVQFILITPKPKVEAPQALQQEAAGKPAIETEKK